MEFQLARQKGAESKPEYQAPRKTVSFQAQLVSSYSSL